MGCDIHFMVEVKQNGKWVSCDEWETEDGWTSPVYEKEYCSDRNYTLFSILAGVRDYDETPYKFDLRGFPSDASEQVRDYYQQWDGDAHTPNCVTLKEIMDFDWTKELTRSAIVNGMEYEKWSRTRKGRPSSYCRGAWGPSIKHISEFEMETIVRSIRTQAENLDFRERQDFYSKKIRHLHTEISWKEPLYNIAGKFLSETVFRMIRLGKAENIRAVFFFDN